MQMLLKLRSVSTPKTQVASTVGFRLTFVLKLTLYWVLYHIMLWNVLFAVRYAEARVAGPIQGVTITDLCSTFTWETFPLLLCALSMLPIFVITVVGFVESVAGPFARFGDVLRRMINGQDVELVVLREADLMDEFGQTFNEYVKVYEQQRQHLSGGPTK